MAVVATFEFNDFVAMGETTRETNSTHGGFGTGADHANHLNRWHQFTYLFGHHGFDFGWGAEAEAVVDRFFDSLGNGWVCMPLAEKKG